ncbi:MAG: hypothetical protein Q7J27_07115 [Syntrophales bacterium]|nr:hypothetical protein [Syntrophales bacterium]
MKANLIIDLFADLSLLFALGLLSRENISWRFNLGHRLIVFKIKDLDDFMDRHRIAVGGPDKGA